MPRLLSALAVSVVALGCATTQAPRTPPGSGPPLYVVPEASCVSDAGSPAAGMVPDAQLCQDLLAAIKRALYGVGYRVVDTPDEPHAASARVAAHQRSGKDDDNRPTAFVTVQVVVESEGMEVERAAEDGNPVADGGEKNEVQTFAGAIANELAHSARMRRAGLVPGT
jgi:hypothetical protein